ncbi:MAG: hypothetical protein ACYCOU_16065 [Sulfobacillus sp.]
MLLASLLHLNHRQVERIVPQVHLGTRERAIGDTPVVPCLRARKKRSILPRPAGRGTVLWDK